MLCVEVDGSGYVVESVGETFPGCSEYTLVTPGQFDRLTYWADLAIELDPSQSAFWLLVAAMISSLGAVLALRVVVRQLRTLNRET